MYHRGGDGGSILRANGDGGLIFAAFYHYCLYDSRVSIQIQVPMEGVFAIGYDFADKFANQVGIGLWLT